MKTFQNLAVLTIVAVLSACTGATTTCVSGHAALETQLYFGLSKKDGAVTAQEWQGFVRREIAPRFPEGFTVADGRGFWLGNNKHMISENSKVVIRIHDAGAKDEQAIAAIIADYKHEFAQESVLRVDMPVCAAF